MKKCEVYLEEEPKRGEASLLKTPLIPLSLGRRGGLRG
jgi:hypothetical protein